METASPWVLLLSRVLMAAIFIQGGINKAMTPAATMATFTKLGLPMPGAAYAVTLAVEIGAGVLFLLGWRARWMALAVWCVATALVAHYVTEHGGHVIDVPLNDAHKGRPTWARKKAGQ